MEIERRTIELVRLTAQPSSVVAASWYVATALPFWITAIVAGGILVVFEPGVSSIRMRPVLLALAVAWPAVCLAEGMQGRRAGTYAWLPAIVVFLIGGYADVQTAQLQWFSVTAMPLGLEPTYVIPAVVTTVAVGIAAGRVRRADGPSLDAPLAMVAAAGLSVIVCGVVNALGMSYVFPRVAVGLLAMFGAVAAEERDIPSAPWQRLAALPVAAICVAMAARIAGMLPGEAIAAGTAAAIALGITMLGHELLWRTPLASLLLRLGVLLGIQRSPWQVYRWSHLEDFITRRYTIPWNPAMIDRVDLAALAVAFASILAVHAWIRRRASVATE
jgi:hypothetical protein